MIKLAAGVVITKDVKKPRVVYSSRIIR